MSLNLRHIKPNHTIIYEGTYALSQPTTTTIVSKEIIQNDEKKESVRQASKTLYVKSGLVKNQKTKRPKEKKSTCKIMEGKTISLFATQIQ